MSLGRCEAGALPDEVTVFSYGSNMNPKTLRDKRRITPSEEFPCVLRGFEMVMGMRGEPAFEPAYATIRPAPGREAHGVAQRMTRDNVRQLLATEAGGGHPSFGYHLGWVDVERYGGGGTERAVTLMCDERIAGHRERDSVRRASSRYIGIIAEGARESGVDEDYVRWLEALPPHRPRWGSYVLLACFAGFIVPIVVALNAVTRFGAVSVAPTLWRFIYFVIGLMWSVHTLLPGSIMHGGGAGARRHPVFAR